MSSCLSGGGRAYRLDLDLIKSPAASWTSYSSSPSSTLSESNTSPIAISTRRARTRRKRPNQTYNEAAAILSTAHPKIFPAKHLTKPCKFTKIPQSPFLFEQSDLLMMPFHEIDNSGYLLNCPPILARPNFPVEPKGFNSSFAKPCQSPGEVSFQGNYSSEICDDMLHQDDFNAESMLDEEIEEGIDSIMGNLSMENESNDTQMNTTTSCYGYPVGLGFDFGHGVRRESRAMRNVDEGDWWRFPSVNVATKIPVEKKKKNKNQESGKDNSVAVAKSDKENLGSTVSSEESIVKPSGGLLLKLNYDNVLNAWSDKGSPFSGDGPAARSAGNDVQARLAQIELFPEDEEGATRGAIVLRYKEKRRTRLFSKKIRYQVRKVKADQRPRMKGRFVRTPNSPDETSN